MNLVRSIALPTMAGMVGKLGGAFKTAGQKLATMNLKMALAKLKMVILKGITIAYTAVQWLLNAAMSANPIGLVVVAIGALIAAGVLLWKNWDTVKEKAIAIWNSIKDFSIGIWEKIVGIFKEHWQTILGILLLLVAPGLGLALLIFKHWGKITEVVSKILDKVVGFFRSNWKLILGIIFPAFGLAQLVIKHWGKIKEKVSEILDAVFVFFGDLWSNITGWFTDNPLTNLIEKHWGKITEVVSKIWEGVSNAVKAAINTIIGFINVMIRAWNGIELKIPGFQKSIFGKKIGWAGITLGLPDLPEIPKLDEGALVDSPTLAALAMNNRPEAVIPLSQLGRMGAGNGLTIVFEGPVYGFDDFAERVQEATLLGNRRGREEVLLNG